MNPVDHLQCAVHAAAGTCVSPWGKKEGVKTRNKKSHRSA